MNADDMAEFDDAHAKLAELRQTSDGVVLLNRFAAGAKSTAEILWTLAKPVLEVAGDVALEELKAYAASLIVKELNRLAGNR